jgi:hypothetical protein
MSAGRALRKVAEMVNPQKHRWPWFAALVVISAICVLQIIVPVKRAAIPCVCIFLIGVVYILIRMRRRHNSEFSTRLSDQLDDGVPPEIVELLADGKKFRAVKRYRELTGTSLPEAKSAIDGLITGTRRRERI